MGVWEWVNSATSAVKQKTPDVTPATEFCRKSYDFCRDSTTSAAGAASAKARDLHAYLSNDQVRDNLSHFAKNVTKHSALCVARSYGGGPIIDIVSRSVQENKKDSQKGRLEELEAKVAKLEKYLSSRKITEQSEIPRVIMLSRSEDEPNVSAVMNQKPEDVLKLFMKEHFVGTKLFDGLMIPTVDGSKKEKPIPYLDGP